MPKIVDHEARRSEISSVVARLIASNGLEGATIREIAQHSGYSKGVVEHYFDNKDELVSGALAWSNRRYEIRVNKATKGLTGMAALRQRIEATLPFNQAVADEWKVRLVFWGMAAVQPEYRVQQEQRFNNAVSSFAEDIEAAVNAGEINLAESVNDSARRLVNMTTGISTAALYSVKLYSKKLLLKEIEYMLGRLGHL